MCYQKIEKRRSDRRKKAPSRGKMRDPWTVHGGPRDGHDDDHSLAVPWDPDLKCSPNLKLKSKEKTKIIFLKGDTMVRNI